MAVEKTAPYTEKDKNKIRNKRKFLISVMEKYHLIQIRIEKRNMNITLFYYDSILR